MTRATLSQDDPIQKIKHFKSLKTGIKNIQGNPFKKHRFFDEPLTEFLVDQKDKFTINKTHTKIQINETNHKNKTFMKSSIENPDFNKFKQKAIQLNDPQKIKLSLKAQKDLVAKAYTLEKSALFKMSSKQIPSEIRRTRINSSNENIKLDINYTKLPKLGNRSMLSNSSVKCSSLNTSHSNMLFESKIQINEELWNDQIKPGTKDGQIKVIKRLKSKSNQRFRPKIINQKQLITSYAIANVH